MSRRRHIRVSLQLTGLACAAAISGWTATASADGGELAPVAASAARARASVIWVDPARETSPRTSTPAVLVGVGLSIVGAVQIPIGVSLLSASQIICPVFDAKRSPTTFSCNDPNSSKHRAGGILTGIGAANAITGIGLTIWGATKKSQRTDVRVGLGSVSASYRF